MTEDDELDNRVGKFIVDVLVSHELSVPQAVQKVAPSWRASRAHCPRRSG